jgi:GxxExxY protein
MRPNDACHAVIGAAIRVHSAVGAGLLERAIHACMIYELREAGLKFEHEVALPVTYKHVRIPLGYRVDFIVEDCLG